MSDSREFGGGSGGAQEPGALRAMAIDALKEVVQGNGGRNAMARVKAAAVLLDVTKPRVDEPEDALERLGDEGLRRLRSEAARLLGEETH